MSVSPNAVPGDQYLGGLFMFLYRAIREHLFLTVLLPLVAAAIAYFAVLQLPPVYTAQGNVRIGRVDGTEAVSITGAVSRVNSLSFKHHLIEAMGLHPVGGDRAAQMIFQSLAAKQEAADTLAVTVRATGAQQARDAAATAVRLLDEEQRKVRETARSRYQGAACDQRRDDHRPARDEGHTCRLGEGKSARGVRRPDIARAAKRVVGRSHLA